MTLEPMDDMVVITIDSVDSVTEAGLHIPEAARVKPTTGVVVAVGPGKYTSDAVLIPTRVVVGDRVAFPKYAGSEFELEGKSYLLIREGELLGRLVSAE